MYIYMRERKRDRERERGRHEVTVDQLVDEGGHVSCAQMRAFSI